MKKIIALLAVLFVAANVQAQTSTFADGDEIVSLGVGFGDTKYIGVPIALSYEHGIMNINDKSALGVGGTFAYQNGAGNYNAFTFAATGSYHYDVLDKLDLFASVSLGYYANNVAGDFYYAVGVGARYYFAETLAAYAKVGKTTTSILEVGVAYRFSVSSLIRK